MIPMHICELLAGFYGAQLFIFLRAAPGNVRADHVHSVKQNVKQGEKKKCEQSKKSLDIL